MPKQFHGLLCVILRNIVRISQCSKFFLSCSETEREPQRQIISKNLTDPFCDIFSSHQSSQWFREYSSIIVGVDFRFDHNMILIDFEMEETRKIIFKFFSPGCAFLQFLLPLPISPTDQYIR